MAARGDCKELLAKAEQTFASASNHLWLDLQRHSWTACTRLGEGHRSVADTVARECAYLLHRLPGLQALSFADGTPFCDGPTAAWLSSQVGAVLAGPKGSAAAAVAPSPLEQERGELHALVADGKVERALGVLQDALRRSSSGELRFRRTLLMGELLLRAREPDIAVELLEALTGSIDAHRLDTWNPDLTLEALAGLYDAYRAAGAARTQGVPAALREKCTAVRAQISRIDSTKALLLAR
jgi:type VI secretion system protein VasJ